MKVRIDGPDQISENGSASSTFPLQPVPSPCTKPCQAAAAWAHVMPGRSTPRMCSIAAAAISLARRMRSTSCGVFSERACTSSGVASAASGKASNQALAERRRLADHAVGGLRAAAQLDRDAPVVGGHPRGELERQQLGGRGSSRS